MADPHAPATGAQPLVKRGARGRPLAPDPEKHCEWCGAQFWRHRHPSGRPENAWKFALRGFCSQACATMAQQRPWTPRGIIARLEAENAAQAVQLAAVEALFAEHSYLREHHRPESRGLYCTACPERYPCAVVELLDSLEKAVLNG